VIGLTGGKEELVRDFFERAVEMWGEEEALLLRSDLERIAQAVWEVENFEPGVEEEPYNPLRRGE
jgi:hypothetical protein